MQPPAHLPLYFQKIRKLSLNSQQKEPEYNLFQISVPKMALKKWPQRGNNTKLWYIYNIDNKDGKNDELCLTNDKDVLTESDTESTSHDNEVPQKHLKEPQVNLIHWNQITPDRVSGKN